MNTLRTIFEKLSKEETQLASHEVDLASVDDLQKQQIKAAKELEVANGLAKGLAASIDKVWQAYRQNSISSQTGLEMADKVISTFKEIGIPPTGAVITWQKEMQANVKNSFAKMKVLDAAKKSIQ
jgi:flagellar hook-basal body complex protein FliE